MIGQRIAVLRRSAGLSQAELARKLRISPSAVGMYEQDRREPAAEILVALSRIFGVSTDYLLTGRPLTGQDAQTLSQIFSACIEQAQHQLERRGEGCFTRQELAALFAAMLMQP